MSRKILIIDDDMDMCRLLERFFSRHDFEVTISNSGKKGLEEIQKSLPDIVLCDFRLGDTDGRELLLKIKAISPQLPVIIITGYSDIKMAVEVMKHGAFDYITKPLMPEEMLQRIDQAIEQATNPPENFHQRKPADFNHKKERSAKYIFGNSKEFKRIIEQVELVAPTNYSVIISGESGSGKEAIAQQIHLRSKRKDAPFIAIDCGVLSNELAASELFGHEKGAFTGADVQKIGNIELANSGTVFLDEIGNLSYDIQVSLLRVVQERKLRRVGGSNDIDLDIRIIVASNERLWDAAQKGKFREDLYYRFNEFSIHIPALRDRKTDILTFAHHFLKESNAELDKHLTGFSEAVENIFREYNWPGNLRELKNVIKRAALLADGEVIQLNTLPFGMAKQPDEEHGGTMQEINRQAIADSHIQERQSHVHSNTDHQAGQEDPKFVKHTLKTISIDAEYEMIVEALKKANFNKSKAAKLLNVDRKTLYNKMKLHNDFKQHL